MVTTIAHFLSLALLVLSAQSQPPFGKPRTAISWTLRLFGLLALGFRFLLTASEHADTSPSSCLHCGLDHESGCCPNFTAEQRRSYNAVLGLPDDRGRLLDAQRQHAAAAADWVDIGGCEFGYAAPLSFFCEQECGGGGMCAWNSLALCLRTCGLADATVAGTKEAVAMWAFANWDVPQARRSPTWGHTVKELVCHRLEGGHNAENYLVGGRDFYGARRWGCLPSDPELKRKYAEMIRESAVWATELELYLAACALGVHVHVWRAGANSGAVPVAVEKREVRIYRTVMPHLDKYPGASMNPFVKEGLATLGSCVPFVRRSALPGDWLLIFKGQSGGLRLLLRLDASRTYAGYMRETNRRGDAIYTRRGVGYQRRNTLFSAEHLTEKE